MRPSLLITAALVGCAAQSPLPGDVTTGDPPPAPPTEWLDVIGEYASGADTMSVREDGGRLQLLRWHDDPRVLTAAPAGAWTVQGGGTAAFALAPDGEAQALRLDDRVLARLSLGAEDGGTFRITPVRPPDELRAEALAATPPAEEGDFLESDLVELVSLDPSIRLDIRYASTNNFMGEVFYSEARAFLQRPAAEALVRAHRWLGERGYGLLIHDGYRPWYVTKMFWEATPPGLKVFVADPMSGSRHNRGAAVDLTLFEKSSGRPVDMPGGYDEFSPRSYPDYPGGTSRRRWYRELLRQAMEREGFTVYEAEWWHFDYGDWRRYRIDNRTFEELHGG